MRPPAPTDLLPWFQTLDDVERQCGRLGWARLFGNEHPVQLDVGCGRGLFLFRASREHPETNFVGIELDYKEGRRGARRLMKRGAANARVLGGNVFHAFRTLIEPASVEQIHVYFPDPWWKRKHRRRRVFNLEFVDLCARLLQPGGLLHSWTDVAEYFEVIAALMNHHPAYEPLPPPPEQPPSTDMDYQTSFERKKRKLGLPIHRGCWRLRPTTDRDADVAGGDAPERRQ